MPKKKPETQDKLKTYREMRSAGATPEPMGGATHRPRMFVVQKHSATRLHYDFRLEYGGALWSWAVPRRPSYNPQDKRMAIRTEDHPVEYADFEGVIPKGNYGAGPVIVWDRGLWVPLDKSIDEALKRGVLHFELQGYKLRGIWMLVRTKGGSPKEWLMIKKKDAWAKPDDEENPPTETSVLSGLTIEELRDGKNLTAAAKRSLKRYKTKPGHVYARQVKLMLAKTADEAFTDKDWLFELKYDGYRLLAERSQDGAVFLRSRNGHDFTYLFPDIALAVKSLPYNGLVLDGEVVCLDADGRPDFGKLQKRAQLSRRPEIAKATVELPATLFVFDLLGFDGFDLRDLPLLKRKRLLEPLMPLAGPLRFAEHVAAQGEAMYAGVQEMGLEGIMAKRADSNYVGGRTGKWLKIPVARTGDFVVCGYTKPKGGRPGFGALHLGAFRNGDLVYTGRVGTGFSDRQLESLHAVLETRRVGTPRCKGKMPKSENHFWVTPDMVVEVEYKTVTADGSLRHPRFLRIRDDKSPEECLLESEGTGSPMAESEPPAEEPPMEKTVELSNLKKMFWPEDGYTKGDLLAYYEAVSPYLLQYLADRPLVLTRYPNGIHGKSFYQKHVPDFVPGWIRTESVWSGSSEREINYYICDDLETLMYIVNSGAIPLHMWHSRAVDIQHPDWCLIDLDPKDAPFKDVITLAKAAKQLCDEIGMPSYPKTTGSTGLHIMLPLGGQCTYEQSRMLGQLLSKVIESRHGDIATTARHIPSRKGKVYLDFLQNRHGQLMVTPYSVRPLPGAPVSAPLSWREVNARLTPQKFTIKNLPARLRRLKKDPNLEVLTEAPDLIGALEQLSNLIAETEA